MTIDTAIFAGGCFWCLEPCFREIGGVLEVESGYCGGTVADPDYEAVCSGRTGHAEVVRIRFDPEQISYRDLLGVFFAIHDPTTRDRQGNDVGTQYRSAVFAQNDAQARAAHALIDELVSAQVFDAPIVTTVDGASPYFSAERYHQRYYEQHPEQGYCQVVVAPKLVKFRQRFAALRN